MPETHRHELTGLPGVPETVLSDALVRGLPMNDAEAPWDVTCSGLIWTGRGGEAARDALPPALRSHRALATVGGFIRYADTPVGVYDEVFGLVASRDGVHPFGTVAFMSVNSPSSLVGGRTNWAMPKTLADFGGAPLDPGGMSATSADGPTWTVTARGRAIGPAIPWRTVGPARQEFPDGRIGTSLLTMKARLRSAIVQVDVQSDGPLPRWLRPGRHLGALIESSTFTLGEPRFD